MFKTKNATNLHRIKEFQDFGHSGMPLLASFKNIFINNTYYYTYYITYMLHIQYLHPSFYILNTFGSLDEHVTLWLVSSFVTLKNISALLEFST